MVQNLSGVKTKDGRCIAFPNIYQHQVQPFSLADKTKPGHRKILALFLVNPDHTVLSTADVAPQQTSWAAEPMREGLEGKNLPVELVDLVGGYVSEAMMTRETMTSAIEKKRSQ